MTTLQDRLADLADEAPPGAPAGDLWDRGRRLHRRRVAGSTAIVVVTVLLLGGIIGLDRSRATVDVEPAGPATELGLPDRLYVPDPHLAGTDDMGPIGPLSAMISSVRESWIGDDPGGGLVGVSATGEYAFLDLPGAPQGAESSAALSADGTRLAYWLAGEPDGSYGGNPEADPLVGVAVYDTVTGEVWRHRLDTEHGVDATRLQWAGDTLWLEVWQFLPPDDDEGWGRRLTGTITWEPESDREEVLADTGSRPSTYLTSVSSWGDELVQLDRKGVLLRTGPDGQETAARRELTPPPQGPAWIAPGGTRVAALRDTDEDGAASNKSEPVVVGSLRGDASVAVSDVPDPPASSANEPGPVRLEELIGWRDESHVVGLLTTGTVQSQQGVVAVDVETGQVERLMPFTVSVFDLAENALQGPRFEATPPPEPLDPRLVWGSMALVVLLAGASTVLWRRRVQR